MEENRKATRTVPEEYLSRIKAFRLMDDIYFTSYFNDCPSCMELVIRIFLGRDDIHVVEVTTQKNMPNLYGHGARLDVFAKDDDGRLYDFEIQRSDAGAIPERARFNSASLDVKILEKGAEYKELPETYIIFVCENDIFARGLAMYHVERVVQETGEDFHDKAHILYINGQYRGSDAVGRLMEDFFAAEPSKMNYKVLADRAKYFKEPGKGAEIMSDIMGDFEREIVRRQAHETALRFILAGKLSLKEIAEGVGLPLTEVEELAKKKTV